MRAFACWLCLEAKAANCLLEVAFLKESNRCNSRSPRTNAFANILESDSSECQHGQMVSVVSGLNAEIDGSFHSSGGAKSAQTKRRLISSTFLEHRGQHSEVGSVRFSKANRFGSCARNSNEKISSFGFQVPSRGDKGACF
jgi:hypothetical protein